MKTFIGQFLVLTFAFQLHAQTPYTYYSCGKIHSQDLITNNGTEILAPYFRAYNSDGSLRWHHSDPSGITGWATTTSYDPETGDAVFSGYFSGQLNVFDTTLIGYGNSKNGFALRVNSAGDLQWFKVTPTLRTSSTPSTLALSDGGAFISTVARGNSNDLEDLDIPTDIYTALLYRVDENGVEKWSVRQKGVFSGETILHNEFLYWQGISKHATIANAYTSWICQLDPETGEILYKIENEGLVLHDARPHSQVSLCIDPTDNNLVSSQVNAFAVLDTITSATSWEKHLVVTKYNITSQEIIYQKTLASQDQLINTFNKPMLFLRDTKVLYDGTFFIAGIFRENDITFHPYDEINRYSETNNNTTDIFLIHLNSKGTVLQTNVYGKANESWVNYLSDDGKYFGFGGCYFREFQVRDSSYVGIDNRNIYHTWIQALPEARTNEDNVFTADNNDAPELISKLMVYPNPVSSGGSVQINYPLEVGVHYELSLYNIEGSSSETALAAFTLSQASGIYVPIGDLKAGLYLISLRGDGEVKTTTKLVVK